MDSVDTGDGTFDVGGHAAGEAGGVDIEDADADAEDNHRTPPK